MRQEDEFYEDAIATFLAERAQGLKPKRSNETIVVDWLKLYAPRFQAARTAHQGQLNAMRFVRWMEERGLHWYTVTAGDAFSYLKSLQDRYAVRTVIAYALGPTSVLDYLLSSQLVMSNPMKDAVRRWRNEIVWVEEEEDHRALAPKEVTQWLAAAPAMREFIGGLVFAKAGIRLGEACLIRDDDVFTDEKLIAIAPHPKRSGPRLKNPPKRLDGREKRMYWVLVDQEAADLLDEWRELKQDIFPDSPYLIPGRRHLPIDGSWMTDLIRRVSRASGLCPDWEADRFSRITAHSFRRTFTTILKTNGASPDVVAELRGDNRKSAGRFITYATQEIYNKIPYDRLRAEYEKAMPEFDAIRIRMDKKRGVGRVGEEVNAVRQALLHREKEASGS